MKNVMKIVLLALCAFALFTMCACGDSAEPVVEVSESIEYEPTVIEVTPEPTDEPTPEPETTDEPDTSEEPVEADLPIELPAGVTVEVAHDEPMFDEADVLQEIIIADNECLNIEVNSLDDGEDDKYTFNVHAENLSSERVVLTLQSVSVNSFNVEPNWSCTVAGDSNLNATVGIVKNIITEYAINHISTVGFTFSIAQEDGTEFCEPITCEYNIEDIVLE